MSSPISSPLPVSPVHTPAPPLAHPAPKLVLAAVVAFVGERLFYDHAVGISLALFLALVGAAALVAKAATDSRPRGRDTAVAGFLLLAGLAPLVESVGPLSLAFALTGLALATAVLVGGAQQGRVATARSACGILLTGPFDLPPDAYTLARRTAGASRLPSTATALGWLVPILLGAVFLGLFALANPLIEGWLAEIPWSALIPRFDLPRILVWLGLAAFSWGFVAPRLRASRNVAGGASTGAVVAEGIAAATSSGLLAPATILRSLVVFNLLFAVQSATDIAYLWAGFALPPGVTHAVYAHRGAYPLVATALLAAAFVLVALRPGGAGERSPKIRALVGLWIGQNMLLVLSAMLRLDLYVEAYGLTLLRLSALIWMALVVLGLALVLARILLRRGNGWLVRANAGALVATLYACAFVNFSGMVADYNGRRYEAGQAFDLPYAMALGVAAIPAVDRVLAGYDGPLKEMARAWRNASRANLRARMQDWHAWTFRNQRLLDYLNADRDAPSPTP